MDVDQYKSEIETKQAAYSNHDNSTVDQTIKSRSRGRPNTKLSTQQKFIGIKREKSTNSVSDNYQKSRLSIASRSAYGVSGMSGANPGYLGGGKRKTFVKADNFGVRNLARRSNFPAGGGEIVTKKMAVRKQQSSPEVIEQEIPEFQIEENAYLQNKFSPRATAGMKSKKNLNLVSPRPLTSIVPSSSKSGLSHGPFSGKFSKKEFGQHSRQNLLPAINTKDETNMEDDSEKPIHKIKSPNRYANTLANTLVSPRMNPMRKKNKNSMLTQKSSNLEQPLSLNYNKTPHIASSNFQINRNIALPRPIVPQTSKAKITNNKSNKIFAMYAVPSATKATPRARQFGNTGKYTKNATAPRMIKKSQEIPHNSTAPRICKKIDDLLPQQDSIEVAPTLKDDIHVNLRVKSHYKPAPLPIVPLSDCERQYLAHLQAKSFKINDTATSSGPYKIDYNLYGTKNSINSYEIPKMQQFKGSQSTSFQGALNYSSVTEYQLGQLLGQGNYAQVKQAIHKQTGMVVAIKIYDKFKLTSNAQIKKSVQREIKLLATLSNTIDPSSENFGQGHPNIMRLYDAIDTPKQLYLILENCNGKILQSVLKKQLTGHLTESQSARIYYQVMKAMDFYHRSNIAHRDVKPENILVDLESPDCCTKVIDFGFAAQSTKKLEVFCGTPAYMSPEICNKTKYLGSATDMWASGILLYTMLFGVQPFKATNEKELFRKIIKGSFNMPVITRHEKVLKFEKYQDIIHVEQIRDLINEILNPDEPKRATAQHVLEKYKTWFESFNN